MKLTDLISAIAESGQLDLLLAKEGVNIASEHLSVYIQPELTAESDIRIFGIEETNEEYEYRQDGVEYIQLFPLYMVVEMVEGGLDTAAHSHAEIANRLIEYRINDA